VKKIASSIKNYGWDQPIVVDDDGEIIKGHGRLQAAELLGLDTVPVITRSDLTDAEKRASRIADNKTAESAWIDDDLTAELNMLADEFEPVELGYDGDELDELIGELEVPEFDPVDEDEQPDLDEKADENAWDENRSIVECPECGEKFVPSDNE
jgi:ParB-like chromosome segregation protein Spo0J